MNDEKVTTLEEVAAAAKAFEEAINSYPRDLQLDVNRVNYAQFGTSKTIFQLRINTNDQVFP